MAAREVVPPLPEPRPLSARYRSLFVLGRGGMGSVEAALETREGEDGYERVVALKRLLPERRDARRVEMFLREAKLAQLLDHPNVVRAYAYGETGGELFLALEYVEGQPLSRLLATLEAQGERLPVDVVVHLLAEACEGLHAAHELRGENGQLLSVVHRDVSPQNVMLGYDGTVRLLDFGIAKIEAESVTKTGEVKGKTAYMSPEQAMGDPLDRRSDLYGVGALLFECLANRRMWGDGTDMEIIRKLALESPPSLTTARDDLPASLVALHARLVARDRDARPATAQEVAEALRAIGTSTSVALASVMTTAFAAEVRAERSRLDDALAEAAPAQAQALRESVLPPAPSPRRPLLLLPLLAALALLATLSLSRPSLSPSPPAPAPAPAPEPAPPIASPTATAPATAPATASASAPANAPANANANANAPANAHANANANANPPANAPARASAPRPSTKPPPPPPPPADVDPAPF